MWTFLVKLFGCACAAYVVLSLMVKFGIGQSTAYSVTLAGGGVFAISWAVGIAFTLFLVSMFKINAKWS
jgi:hypothetical protein